MNDVLAAMAGAFVGGMIVYGAASLAGPGPVEEGPTIEAPQLGSSKRSFSYLNRDPMGPEEANALLEVAQGFIGTPYSKMDCSGFVRTTFQTARKPVTFTWTGDLSIDPNFEKVTGSLRLMDVALWRHHVGFYDPNPPKPGYNLLSSTSSRGVIYGKPEWFIDLYGPPTYYRYVYY